jgi:hypothetical protein
LILFNSTAATRRFNDRFGAVADALKGGIFDPRGENLNGINAWSPTSSSDSLARSPPLGPTPVRTLSYPAPQQPQQQPPQPSPLDTGLDAINSAAGPGAGVTRPAPPAMGPGQMMPSAREPKENVSPFNIAGEALQGMGASLMSIYDPKGGAVLADLQKNGMAARQKPGKFSMHYDPTTGQLFRIDTQTGEVSLQQGAAKPEVDPYKKKYQEQNAEAWVKRNSAIIDGASKSNIAMGDAQTLKQLLANPDVYQGPGAPLFGQFKTLVNNIFPGMYAGVADTQLAQAISAKMALEIKTPELAGAMPGALSDNDLKFLRSMPPGIENSREANPKIADYWIKLAQRSQDIEKLRDAYVQKFGMLDDGFQKIVSKYAASNHLFAGEKWDAPGATAPATAAPANRPPINQFLTR